MQDARGPSQGFGTLADRLDVSHLRWLIGQGFANSLWIGYVEKPQSMAK